MAPERTAPHRVRMEAGRIGGLEGEETQVDTASPVGRQLAQSIERARAFSKKVEKRSFPLPPVGRRSGSEEKRKRAAPVLDTGRPLMEAPTVREGP